MDVDSAYDSDIDDGVVDVASALNFASAGSLALINGLETGTDIYQRLGRKIYMKMLLLKGWISALAAGSATDSFCRLMVVYDLTPNGAAFSKDDLLANISLTGSVTNTGLSFWNPNNRARFKILADECFAFPAQSTTEGLGSPTVEALDLRIILEQETVYNSLDEGTIADINSGALYLFVTNDSGSSEYGLTFVARLIFSDL